MTRKNINRNAALPIRAQSTGTMAEPDMHVPDQIKSDSSTDVPTFTYDHAHAHMHHFGPQMNAQFSPSGYSILLPSTTPTLQFPALEETPEDELPQHHLLYSYISAEFNAGGVQFEDYVNPFERDPKMADPVYEGWHADIKPDNILRVDGRFKLADPGFAKFQRQKEKPKSPRTSHQLIRGTTTYGAPKGHSFPDRVSTAHLSRTPSLTWEETYRRVMENQRFYRGGTSTSRSRNYLPVLINGQEKMALPDTMSSANVITEEYAKSQGAFIDRDPSKRQVFVNAIGTTFKSLGQAIMQFSFPDTPGKVLTEVFSVVTKCATSLVLGDSFLKKHQIFTHFKYRLKKVAITARMALRLMHMDVPYQKFMCHIDGEHTAMTVDTGSEKNFFSSHYVRLRRWKTQSLPPDRGFVELADGEIVKASGYVDKEIGIGEHRYKKRFYILTGLMCDVLLGEQTIEEVDLYNEANERHWVDSDSSASYFEFHAISWLDEVEDHATEFLNNPKYKVADRRMQQILNEIQRQNAPSEPSSSTTRRRKWWNLRQRSQSRRETRIDEQYQLLLSGIWIKLGKLDNDEMSAREMATRAMSQAAGDDLRRMRNKDDTRRQEHMDKQTRLRELRSKLLEWKGSRTSQTT